ncbi:MAG: hypothetical protein ACFFD6_00760 [Candidatus Thorarchaeota archaeon]
MSDKNLDHIKKLIDSMQSALVELFDQLHELRRQLDLASEDSESGSSLSPAPVFSKVTPSSSTDSKTENTDSPNDLLVPDSLEPPIANEKVDRVLDPITHELQTGEAPAEVIAEYLQAAKDYLVNEGSTNEKVDKDMDVVLKFLRARGKRGIRPEERDNILERIRRWKAHIAP